MILQTEFGIVFTDILDLFHSTLKNFIKTCFGYSDQTEKGGSPLLEKRGSPLYLRIPPESILIHLAISLLSSVN